MSLKSILTCVLLPLTLLLTLGASAFAAPPTLTPANDFPTSVVPGHTYEFKLNYKQPEGDPPTVLKMIIDAPGQGGQISKPIAAPGGDPTSAAGIPLDWTFSPDQSGQYQYHFEVTSSTGGFARYPVGNNELTFESPSPYVKWIVLAAGLVIALFFLPFVVYMMSRSLNKRSDPSAAARIALLIGILAFCGLAWYLFLQNEETRMIGIGIEAIAIGAFLVVILNRRRAA